MAKARPSLYTIAAHRGFADALVAGLVPLYADAELGLAKVTLLVPSARAARTLAEAFIRHAGDTGSRGLLMPRMVAIGDLELDEALGHLLDPLGAVDIAPASDPMRRWFELARLIEAERKAAGDPPLGAAARLRMARDLGRAMDRLLAEEKTPEDLLGEKVLDQLGDLSGHWQGSIRLFARVQARWLAQLEARGEVDAATRRNLLFDRARREWNAAPPAHPIIAAGVTSAAPALARLLRTIAQLPEGAVILPDLDLTMSDAAWEELGDPAQGAERAEGDGASDAAASPAPTHPQFHLKLLLARMGVQRGEFEPWPAGAATGSPAPPTRSNAVSALFLPPRASREWARIPADERRLDGVRLLTMPTSEHEAQAIALTVREALEVPEKRIAIVTADRVLARRIVQHLERWNIMADDSAGRPLSLTPAGRMLGLMADLMAEGLHPVSLTAAFAHPLVQSAEGEARSRWLANARAFERELRGPLPASNLEPYRQLAQEAQVSEWWESVETALEPLWIDAADGEILLAKALDRLVEAIEALCGEACWAREDGRSLARLIDDLRFHSGQSGTALDPSQIAKVLREAMDEIAVRPSYGAHTRIAIYGLLEARMARADLTICAGLNEGSWPQAPAPDPLLAPAILRALGVPGAEFRIGLAAHDLAAAMSAREVMLTRSERDTQGPARPSRFWLRIEALLGSELAGEHREERLGALAHALDRAPQNPAPAYPRPMPDPSPDQRMVAISVTALDKLLGDPYQFYAQQILGLRKLDQLAEDPFSNAALRGTLAHDILDGWTKARRKDPALDIAEYAEEALAATNPHPLLWSLWRPRFIAALQSFERKIIDAEDEGRKIAASEAAGRMIYDGVTIKGRADRIDALENGSFVIVDYKTGNPPKVKQMAAGYALQLGTLGLILRDGQIREGDVKLNGAPSSFEYWSLAKNNGIFGKVRVHPKPPTKSGDQAAMDADFLEHHEKHLGTAIRRFIKGREPFTAKENPDYEGFTDYDQLMRLEEWKYAIGTSGVKDQGS